ncbi:hypothetical protein [Buttiauxella noackiae]|uniref:hypothetical protein n=1 Tax=Buttiauxella noackiae TaxID=82992 RepID=UPI00055589D4|nr:hypothetical protein [Buttiauxella noackiae]
MKLGLLVTCMMLTTSVYASPVKYTCEDDVYAFNGLARSWEATLDIDYSNGAFKSFTLDGETLKGFKFNNESLLSYQDTNKYNTNSLPAIALYEKEIKPDALDNIFFFVVFGKGEIANTGDVIAVFPPFGKQSYYCYKHGSYKDNLMHGLRDSHNKGILEAQQGN